MSNHPLVMSTYSIAACDPSTGEVGVAVQSKYFAVGALVVWARAGAGAAASQAATNSALGERALALLAEGAHPEAALKTLLENEPDSDRRQVGLVDPAGRSAAFTGERCLPYAGHITGREFCCQGNCLAGPQVLEAMAKGFVQSDGDLPQRLLKVLFAAENAGGDARGSQSAALLVASPRENLYAGAAALTDLRIDDHPHPISELDRLLQLHRLYFSANYVDRCYPFGAHQCAICADWLGQLHPDKTVRADPAELGPALLSFAEERGCNLDEKPPPGMISGVVVHHLAEAYFELEAARLRR